MTRLGLSARLAVHSRRMASGALSSCGVACVAVGCSASPGEGRSLGADLGTFSVEAERGDNDCGTRALDNPVEFTFEVDLERADTELFWGGSPGTLSAGLDFELEAAVRVELRAPRAEDPGCSLSRADRIAGVLTEDADGAVTSFIGEMAFAFSAPPESTCTLDEQQAAGLSRLPCRMSYALQGRRTRAPMP